MRHLCFCAGYLAYVGYYCLSAGASLASGEEVTIDGPLQQFSLNAVSILLPFLPQACTVWNRPYSAILCCRHLCKSPTNRGHSAT